MICETDYTKSERQLAVQLHKLACETPPEPREVVKSFGRLRQPVRMRYLAVARKLLENPPLVLRKRIRQLEG